MGSVTWHSDSGAAPWTDGLLALVVVALRMDRRTGTALPSNREPGPSSCARRLAVDRTHPTRTAPPGRPAALAEAINRRGTPRPGGPRGPVPIPSPGDRRTMALLDRVRAGEPAFREAVAAGGDDRGATALLIFAVRMAALAVRTGERAHLARALLAPVLAIQGTADERDIPVAVPLPAHSARLLGVDPIALFDEAAAIAPVADVKLLRQLAPSGDLGPVSPQPGRKIGGYYEGADEDDFRFVRAGAG